MLLSVIAVTFVLAVWSLFARLLERWRVTAPMVFVLAALPGSRFSWPERVLLGWIGPRGTTSIVFGLLAFNVLSDEAETDALLTMVVVVLGSVVMHGIGVPAAARAFRRSQPRMGS